MAFNLEDLGNAVVTMSLTRLTGASFKFRAGELCSSLFDSRNQFMVIITGDADWHLESWVEGPNTVKRTMCTRLFV